MTPGATVAAPSTTARRSWRAWAQGIAVAALVSAAVPAQAATGDGTFDGRGLRMPVASAMAFRGNALLDKTDVIIVAITNGDLRTDGFATFHDRRRALEQRREPDIAVVWLEFKPDGAYRGLSYYFRSGNNCGYCGEA